MARRGRARRFVAASVQAYRLLLWAYPAAFRRAYGADMAQLFRDCCRDAYRRRRLIGLGQLWLATLWDLGISLPREHLERLSRSRRRSACAGSSLAPQPLSLGRPRYVTRRGAMHNNSAATQRLWWFWRRIRGHRSAMVARPQPNWDRDRFEKFTERARRVLSLAQEEAQRLHHNSMGTEHLLLGLVREGDGVAARVLAHQGVSLAQVREAVEFIIGRGDHVVTGEIGLTPRAKRVIELAVDEARRLNHHYIGTEHLLLGLIREGEGIAAGVLERLGLHLPNVRAETLRVLGEPQPPGDEASDSGESPPDA
jgi:hypothetical protein